LLLAGQKRGAHESTRSASVFIEQRRADVQADREDFYFHENSFNFPASIHLGIPLRKTHGFITAKLSGVLIGLPYNRPRSFTFGFDKRRWEWKGSPNPQLEFERLFERSVQLTGDVFLQEHHDAVVEYYKDGFCEKYLTIENPILV
jgi:hypothetical protein